MLSDHPGSGQSHCELAAGCWPFLLAFPQHWHDVCARTPSVIVEPHPGRPSESCLVKFGRNSVSGHCGIGQAYCSIAGEPVLPGLHRVSEFGCPTRATTVGTARSSCWCNQGINLPLLAEGQSRAKRRVGLTTAALRIAVPSSPSWCLMRALTKGPMLNANCSSSECTARCYSQCEREVD
jgi:hypothetical protein